jgi:hypothetical protein
MAVPSCGAKVDQDAASSEKGPAFQDLSRLRPAIRVAQEMAKRLA